MQVIMSSLPEARCLYVGHNMKIKKVFIAIEGLSREQFEQWEAPVPQLRGIASGKDILSVMVSCSGQHTCT